MRLMKAEPCGFQQPGVTKGLVKICEVSAWLMGGDHVIVQIVNASIWVDIT